MKYVSILIYVSGICFSGMQSISFCLCLVAVLFSLVEIIIIGMNATVQHGIFYGMRYDYIVSMISVKTYLSVKRVHYDLL